MLCGLLNAFHTMRSGHVFDIIPPKQIKSIHLHEDSYGRTLWDQDILEEFFVQFLKAPVFLHIGLKSQAVSHRIKEKYIIQKTWRQMEAELADAQKTLIAQIIGIDIAQMNVMFKDKPVAVFFDDPALTAEESRKFLQKLSETKEIKKIIGCIKIIRGEEMSAIRMRFCGNLSARRKLFRVKFPLRHFICSA